MPTPNISLHLDTDSGKIILAAFILAHELTLDHDQEKIESLRNIYMGAIQLCGAERYTVIHSALITIARQVITQYVDGEVDQPIVLDLRFTPSEGS